MAENKMPKYINLETTLAGIENVLREKTDKRDSLAYFAFRLFAETLKQVPTADVVEVVRCKDCQHARQTVYGNYHCLVDHRLAHEETDYCSYGERKEGVENG